MSETPGVVMYGTLLCPYCRAARDFLDRRAVAYEEIRVDLEPGRRAEMQARGGGHTVPQIWIGETHVGGYTDMLALERDGRLDALLESGAPR
jgi:glutaredoxin 3